MTRIISLISIVCITFDISLLAQSAENNRSKSSARFELGIEQDANFGFYPSARAVLSINDAFEVGGYGNYYTNPTYAAADGTGPWTEFGLLMNFLPLQNKYQDLFLSVNLGLSNGNILSGDSIAHFGEGFSVGIVAAYNYSGIELLATGNYYAPFKERGIFANSFYFYSLSAGFYFLSVLSAGIHYEENVLNFLQLNEREQSYEWLGPYVQFLINETYSLRFTGGWDLSDNGISTFYKLGLNITFE